MQAVIMAGGEGSRLRPLTIGRPKPMIPLVNKPILVHILDLLRRHGITDVVITVQYMAELIQSYFGDGHEFDMRVRYSLESVPLGTAGGVKLAARYIQSDPFLVISGDALTDIDLKQLIDFHRQMGAPATVALARVGNPLEYGLVVTDKTGRIVRFVEKPGWSDVVSDTVNTGIYVLNREVLDLFEEGQVFDFSHDLFPLMIEQGTPPYGYVVEGYWTDIGNPAAYRQATEDVLYGHVQVEPIGKNIGGEIYCGGTYQIAPDAQLYGPIYLGDGVKILGGVVIHGPAVIRDNVFVDTGSHIERSIIWRNTYIGERSQIRGAIIGRQCSIKSRVIVSEGAIIADNTLVREGAIIQPNVKIWPDKEIEAGATVSSSIVWGAQGRRTLFGRYGVTGLVNVDLTPEFAARLGAAYGATLPLGATVTVNREAHNTPRMIKRALLSGLPSAGVHVLDTRTQPIPVARFYTFHSGARGGVHVRLSPFDNRVVDIKVFDERGLDLGRKAQRNVENIFFREDFRRVYLDEIGRIEYAPNVTEVYCRAFLDSLERELWPLPGMFGTVVVDYANAVSALILPQLLSDLDVDVVALNAGLDERKLFRTREQFDEGMRRLAAITQVVGGNFGVRLDVGGERIFITTADGAVIPNMDAFLAVTRLVFDVWPHSTVGVPVTAPRAFEQLAVEMGGRIKRLKTDPQALMEAALSGEFVLVGDGSGGFIFPLFTPYLDGMFATLKIMELCMLADTPFGDAVRLVPPYAMARTRVPCRWEDKGRLMRLLNERLPNTQPDTVPEGVVVDLGEREWVLITPVPDEPFFLVVAEGASPEEANNLVERYSNLLAELLEK